MVSVIQRGGSLGVVSVISGDGNFSVIQRGGFPQFPGDGKCDRERWW